MSKDQLLGVLILLGAVAVLGLYSWLIYAGLSWWAFFIVSTVAVVGVMGIIAWIGWTMATTPAPTPIEGLEDTAQQVTGEEKTDTKKE
jgi:hypothetical protein